MTLIDIIRNEILHNGPMDVGTFMNLALGHPEHGYYMKRDPLGAAGDFTTAPEISQMFGEMIGAWVADLWGRMGNPAPFVLAEAGPGRGTLMKDALRASRTVPGFHAAMSVHLLETSPVLREAQGVAFSTSVIPAQAGTRRDKRHSSEQMSPGPRLRGDDDKIEWHDNPERFFVAGEGPFFLIANEFLDALPVRQLQWQEGRWHERCVTVESEELAFGLGPEGSGLVERVPAHLKAREGDIYEVSLARAAFMKHVCEALNKRGGAALLIDYGHAVSGFGDTVQAMKKHEYAPVLNEPGEADLTAHVDFAALAGEAAGCRVFGPVEQSAFLEALGIRERAAMLEKKATAQQALDVRAALQRLTASEQMGRLFKVMALTAGYDNVPAGFNERSGS